MRYTSTSPFPRHMLPPAARSKWANLGGWRIHSPSHLCSHHETSPTPLFKIRWEGAWTYVLCVNAGELPPWVKWGYSTGVFIYLIERYLRHCRRVEGVRPLSRHSRVGRVSPASCHHPIIQPSEGGSVVRGVDLLTDISTHSEAQRVDENQQGKVTTDKFKGGTRQLIILHSSSDTWPR